jgi:hypothetical protein
MPLSAVISHWIVHNGFRQVSQLLQFCSAMATACWGFKEGIKVYAIMWPMEQPESAKLRSFIMDGAPRLVRIPSFKKWVCNLHPLNDQLNTSCLLDDRWVDGWMDCYDTIRNWILWHLAESLNIWANWSLILDITTIDFSFQYFQPALTLYLQHLLAYTSIPLRILNCVPSTSSRHNFWHFYCWSPSLVPAATNVLLFLCSQVKESLVVLTPHASCAPIVVKTVGPISNSRRDFWELPSSPLHSVVPPTPRALSSKRCE